MELAVTILNLILVLLAILGLVLKFGWGSSQW